MNTKNSKKIVPATVFAAIIVLLAFAVMSTTVSAQVEKTLDPVEGGLGTEVTVTIDVTVGAGQTVTVVDTLPPELSYITETFSVDGVPATPTVTKQVISYTITNLGDEAKTYTIEFDVKVTEASWEDVTVTNEVSDGTNGDSEEFTINKFTDLYKDADGPDYPVIGEPNSWTLKAGVTNNFGYIMTATKIYDRFGGDLKIDFITLGATTYKYTYNEYGTKQATVTIEIFVSEEWQETIGPIPLEMGITTEDGTIYWTGRTHKAHVAWTIGALADEDSAEIIIGVSTDTNPKGHQEYTEIGDHYLTSGATLKFIDDTEMQLSAVTDSIMVEAVEESLP